ncbi:N-acetylmuramoyl-L-alanine amidase [Pseudomonas sp. Ant30-3]|nr:N-acetylmuramoyl-L-alanine amidase [Pseudomonas sp. Ant30-3]
MHRRSLLNLFLAGLAFALPLDLRAAQVRNARLWNTDDKLRLVLDLSGPTQYKTFSLTAPDRLILDLLGTGLAFDLSKLQLGNTPIRAIRSGPQGTGTRIVLDLAGPVQLNTFMLAPEQAQGHRLVLDISSAASPPIQLAVPAVRQAELSDSAHPKRDIIVVVDPGHGGKDPGAVGAKGEREKDVVLSIARQLAKRIEREKGFTVRLVRNSDVYVPLRKRVEIARQHNADIFISIHADAAPRRTASGASIYALSEGGATSTTARWLAQKENGAELLGTTKSLALKDKDPMLAGVILDMSMSATVATSLELGHSVLRSLASITTLHQKRVEQAGFAVLKSPDVPSILVETGFISNTQDCQRLVSARHQQALANSLFDGLRQHFYRRPPVNTYLAWQKDQERS